jgi:hypothetical protein
MKHPLELAYENYNSSIEQSKAIKNNARRMFGMSLRDTRSRLGLSVRQLGEKIGVTGSLIHQVETSCRSVLKIDHVIKIVELCSEEKPHSKQKADSKSAEAS